MKATITCSQLAELLLDFVGGDLDEAQRAAFAHHLCGCQPCVIVVETYKATVTVGRALRVSDGGLPPGLEARLRAALAAEGFA